MRETEPVQSIKSLSQKAVLLENKDFYIWVDIAEILAILYI